MMVQRKSPGKIVFDIFNTLFMIFLMAVCLLPVLHVIFASFSDAHWVMNQTGLIWRIKGLNIEGYKLVFANKDLISGYLNTFLYVIASTALGLFLTVITAYAVSRKDALFSNFIMFFISFTMLFNGGLVPTYMMWTQTFGIKNTIWALIVPKLMMSAFYVIMMRSFFQSSIPESLVEAARIDGGGEFKILFSIVLPLSKPMVVTISLMAGLGYWNDWTNSLYYITNESLFSIQGMLNTIMTNIQFLANSPSGVGTAITLPSAGVRMAIAVIGVVPILCIYPFFQKYFVKGIVVGGVKG